MGIFIEQSRHYITSVNRNVTGPNFIVLIYLNTFLPCFANFYNSRHVIVFAGCVTSPHLTAATGRP